MAHGKKKSKREGEGKIHAVEAQTTGTEQATEEERRDKGRPGHITPVPDHTDRVIEEWARERPDLDISAMAIINRMSRLLSLMRPEIEAVHERFGLSDPSFSVLAALRRAGSPYQVTQRALMDALQLTSGTVSVRIDRLVRDGLVERLPDPNDQRGVLVRLTEKGEKLFDQVAPLHLSNEERLLSALRPDQREQLADLLRTLLLSFEKPSSDGEQDPAQRIGVSLAPAHVARQVRRSVGLPDPPGLLVQNVRVPGPAARAGLQVGDLIVAANDVDTPSITSLYEQLAASEDETVYLDVMRGTKRLSLELPAVETASALRR